MKVIRARNVEHALFDALILMRDDSIVLREDSRNGPVMSFDEPVTTVYYRPRERVVLDQARDCNPFLHLFESLWMLAGRNDVEFLREFTANMDQFSDDEKILNGAYGYRWRTHFGHDQIAEICQLLDREPTTRRAVLSMWDPYSDLTNQGSKDLPCNTQVVFRVIADKLDMTVFNRSNDMIWGAYGANAVHFSFLQEYVACLIGKKVGIYRQVSNNLHLYPEIPVAARMLKQAGASAVNHYEYGTVDVSPLLMGDGEDHYDFVLDLTRFMEKPAGDWDRRTVFFDRVAVPMYRAWLHRASDDPTPCQNAINRMADCDWKLAAVMWINRRREAKGRTQITL